MEVPASSSSNNNNQLQHMLQSAVQAVQWTYILFWHYCPQQGILVWADGYYNGAIKTRKMVQPIDTSGVEEACLQRSQQLKELYESLSAAESTTQAARRPCAALSPEDLTESEWFYLMCVSFSFPPGVGLPGKAYANGHHIWLTGANEVESKVFSRTILAKTVVCIPVMDGVVELGYTKRVQEDPSFIQQVRSFFDDHYHHHQPHNGPQLQSKPTLSEQSTSNPSASSTHSPFQSPLARVPCTTPDPLPIPSDGANNDDEDDETEGEADSDCEAQTSQEMPLRMELQYEKGLTITPGSSDEPSELMQMEMSEDAQLGSPDDASNNLDSDFPLVITGPPPCHLLTIVDSSSILSNTNRRWPVMQQQQLVQDPVIINGVLQTPLSDMTPMEELSQDQEDTHYSQTVSIILQLQSSRWAESSSNTISGALSCHLSHSSNSAFSSWKPNSNLHHSPTEGTSQWLLKYILFTVPSLHSKYHLNNNASTNNMLASGKGSHGGANNDELSANHVLAERRRREKLNERFIILRSLVPFVTKMDKASILGDTIEYVKELRKKIEELERCTKFGEEREKRKIRMVEETRGSGYGFAGGTKAKTLHQGNMLEVSIIESDALVELKCPHKEGLLLDIMIILRDMHLEVTTVQSSFNNGFLAAELRGKVNENANGKKPSIIEVKRAVNQFVPQNEL